jgi:hypothetical protein
MKADKFFCLCEDCGSMTWEDASGNNNTLDEDGNLLEENDLWITITNPPFCHECEKPLRVIPFSRVKKRDRKKIYKMSDEMRIKWVKSFQILDELEENEKAR